MSGPSDGLEADGVAESGEAFSNSNHQHLSITTALKWISEHLSPMLQGFNPTDQTNVDKLLRWSQNTQASLKEHEGCYDNHALIHTGTTEVVSFACSDFFMARYLEHKDSLNIEKEDELRIESVSEAPPQATPTSAPTKDKKGSDKGKEAYFLPF